MQLGHNIKVGTMKQRNLQSTYKFRHASVRVKGRLHSL
jgi:hypothetical protein